MPEDLEAARKLGKNALISVWDWALTCPRLFIVDVVGLA